MTTHADSPTRSPDRPDGTRRRPAVVIVATVLTVLLAALGTYGAFFFSGLDGYDPVDATFLCMYAYLSAIGIVAAIAQLGGSPIGQAGVVAWGIFMALFTLVKLVTIQETEAIAFGVVALIVVALELSPPAQRFFRAARV